MRKLYQYLVIVFVVFTLNCSAAQPQMAPRSMPMVKAVRVEFNGHQNASDQAVKSRIVLQPGQKYNQALVNRSIHSLYNMGFFESIRVKMDEVGEDEVDVTFIVDPKMRIDSISFTGNQRISVGRLEGEISSKENAFLDEAKLNRDVQKLSQYYHKNGYSDVAINYCIDGDREVGKGCVTFQVIEGDKRRITKISFCGHEPCGSRKLRSLMQTKEWGLISYISGKGRFKQDQFQEDLQRLKHFYRDQGYLDVDISENNVIFECCDECTLKITINIDKGRQYHIGCVSISGNDLFCTDKLMELLTVCQGNVFSPSKIAQSEELLRDAYGQVGYLDTVAVAERIPNIDTGCVDINFRIRESEKFCLESIKITGNTTTRSNVILRELALAPGDVFDLVRMKSSQKRLENTRFFDEVNFIPEYTGIPGRRNLLIAVKEGKTGNLQFGVSVSSVENFVGSVEFSQSNFDLFNHRNYFQGAGQKFRLRGRLGKRSNQIILSFEEPWLFERELALGFSVFRTRSDYLSDTYDEMRVGFNVGLRKRLCGLIDGSLSYLLEEVKIFNVNDKASDLIKAEAGKRTISKLGLGLSYDTRDNLLYPTSGSSVNTRFEVAGGILQGQTDYVRLELTAAQWFKVCDALEQTIVVGGMTGTIISYGNQAIPYFDRYFLGGPDTLRGFNFRKVGPRDKNAEPLGGDTVARATAEYSLKLMDPVRFAVFYDIGFLNQKDMNWSPSKYNDNWGFGLRVFILGAPLRLDWGFPLTTDGINGKKSPLFHFSFGTTF